MGAGVGGVGNLGVGVLWRGRRRRGLVAWAFCGVDVAVLAGQFLGDGGVRAWASWVVGSRVAWAGSGRWLGFAVGSDRSAPVPVPPPHRKHTDWHA